MLICSSLLVRIFPYHEKVYCVENLDCAVKRSSYQTNLSYILHACNFFGFRFRLSGNCCSIFNGLLDWRLSATIVKTFFPVWRLHYSISFISMLLVGLWVTLISFYLWFQRLYQAYSLSMRYCRSLNCRNGNIFIVVRF